MLSFLIVSSEAPLDLGLPDLCDARVARDIVRRFAALRARLAPEIGRRPLVLPNGSYFPDRFDGDAASVERLLDRMRGHAGMLDIPVGAAIAEQGAGASPGGGCGSGACAPPAAANEARLLEEGDGFRVLVSPAEVAHPVALTTSLARSLGAVFLVDTREEGEAIAEPFAVTVELTAVALGFGGLLLQGAYVYAKSCGGPSVTQLTTLGCQELAVAVALFASASGHKLRGLLAELEATQRAALRQAGELFDANPKLVELLLRHPEQLAAGQFEIEPVRPRLLRWFQRRGSAVDADPTLDELERMAPLTAPKTTERRSPPPADDLKRLVQEELEAAEAERA